MDYPGLPQVSPHASHASILSTSWTTLEDSPYLKIFNPCLPSTEDSRKTQFLMIKELLRSGNHPERYVVHPRKPSKLPIPIGTWTEDYKTFLETEVSKSEVLKVDSHYTEADVRFVLRYATAQDAEAAMTSDALKLTTEPKNLRMMSIYSMLLRL
jgi:hypothetical protein